METISELKILEQKIELLNLSLDNLKTTVEEINKKIDILCNVVEEHIVPDCDKMSAHINFIEAVYNTVKNPLGFICNRINKVLNGRYYSLTNTSHTSLSHPSREISIQ
jgi:hypothetical protein